MSIEVINMDDIDTSAGGDDAGQGQQQQQQRQAPPVPQIDVNGISEQITRNVMGSLAPALQTQRSGNAIDATAREMIASGVPPSAVQAIIRMNLAVQEEAAKAQQSRESQKELDGLVKGFWKQADDVFDRYEAKFKADCPGLEYAREGILNQYRNKIMTDPKFAREVRRVSEQGELPTSSGASQAMAEVVADFMTKIGAKKPAQTVNMSSSKPASNATSSSDLSRLDGAQRKMYNAFRKTKGDEFDAKAFERAIRK